VAPQKIAFVKCGSFSHINANVEAQLRRQFPECEVVVFDVREKLRRSPLAVVRGLAQGVVRHGLKKLRADPIDGVVQTPATFRFIRRWIADAAGGPEFLFTFQTQSMWDASTPGRPHFVYTDHTEQAARQYRDFEPRQLKGAWWTELETQIYQRATMTFTMSEHVSRSLREDYGVAAGRVARVGGGSNAPVETEVLPDSSRYRRKEIIFVGTDWERKGGPELVAAFQKILPRHPDARLRVLGCNPEIQLPNCEVLGRVPLAEVARAYATASLFCLPTRHEPFGIVLIEAMLAGLAVVATDAGAVPDLIEDGVNGRRVEPYDVEGLAATLSRLLDQPDVLETMGRRSARLAREQHTWEAVGARLRQAILPHVPALRASLPGTEDACVS